MGSPAYPFYFAWVDPTETTFGSQHEVVDEDVFSFSVKHDEGQIPTLSVTIKNPRAGLLTAGRKVWCWLSHDDLVGTVTPLFFGELVGIPSNVFAELVTLQFHARPTDYIERKQAVAEAMRIFPYFDPIWIAREKRDDPDAILEGWSSLYHVDRTTHVVSASDILTGEDGLIDFGTPTATHAFYDSLDMRPGEAPLTNVRIDATVKWTQRWGGLLPWDTVAVASYTGDGFMNEWPKAGTTLGPGWKVETSFVNDIYLVGVTPGSTYNYSWKNPDKEKLNCDPDSVQVSSSGPALLSPHPLTCALLGRGETGICDPFADPQVNRPAHIEGSGVIVPQWFLTADMTLRYEARRQFTEELVMDVRANTQGVLTSPLVSQHTEVLKISGADVGEPLEEMYAWSDFAGHFVALGTIIFPNDPKYVGGTSYQICIANGTAGTHEPVFSDTPGDITIDGSVEWSSLGDSPLTSTPRWSPNSPVPAGEIICFIPQYQQALFNTEAGDFEPDLNSAAYYLCVREGITNGAASSFSYIPTAASSDTYTQEPVLVNYIQDPTFSAIPGTGIIDGSVMWISLGMDPAVMAIPLGGTPLKMGARCFFPTARGHNSVAHLICRARARLRKRGRAVTVGWKAPFANGLALSCRKDARIQDPRLPGGEAQGKVISYELCMETGGKWYTQVEIGCSVGYAGTVTAVPGAGTYASSGYMQTGYQQLDSTTIVVPTDNSDIGYTPPLFRPFDDGVSFPLHRPSEVRVGEAISNNAADQAAYIMAGCPASATLANLENPFFPTCDTCSTRVTGTSFNGAWAIEQAQRALASSTLQYRMGASGIGWTLFLKPLVNGPFNGAYSPYVTPLELPQGINLEAVSSI